MVTQRWSPYFANPPFVVAVELRRAGRTGLIGSLALCAFGLRVVSTPGPTSTDDLLATVAMVVFFTAAFAAVGLYFSLRMSQAAAKRVDQPLIIVWPRRTS